jgi:hypothetical protein
MDSEISVIDETFDSHITSSYFLSIQVSLDGFSFCSIDPVTNKYLQFRHIKTGPIKDGELADKLNKIFEQTHLLNLPYKKVFVLFSSPCSTLVPAGIFKPEHALNWLSFCHKIPKGHTTLHTKMKLADAWNVFSVPQSVIQLFKRQFPEPLFFHQYSPMVETKLAVNRFGEGQNLVLINLQTDCFNIAVLEKNNLILCNSFKIKGDKDLLYFTLFVFEQLQLSPRTTEVLLTGWHPDFQSTTQSLTKYIKNIKLAGQPGSFQYCPYFKEVSGTRFHNLLSLASCV